MSSLTSSLSLIYSDLLALPSQVTVTVGGGGTPSEDLLLAEQMLYIEGTLEQQAEAYAAAIESVERSLSMAVLSGTQEEAARDVALTQAMEEYQVCE